MSSSLLFRYILLETFRMKINFLSSISQLLSSPLIASLEVHWSLFRIWSNVSSYFEFLNAWRSYKRNHGSCPHQAQFDVTLMSKRFWENRQERDHLARLIYYLLYIYLSVSSLSSSLVVPHAVFFALSLLFSDWNLLLKFLSYGLWC